MAYPVRGRRRSREPPGGRRRGWLGFHCQPSTARPLAVPDRKRSTHVASASRPAPSGNGDYTARHLQVLEGLEAVRKRPGMYIGSTDQRGLMHCLWEIIDNAVDEALAGVCTGIEVILSSDGSIEVRDNGRGIPVDIEPRTGLSGVEVVFTKLHAGGKFGGASYAATGGLHGVGASVVNALSARLDVEVDRAGKTYGMSFRRGEPGTFTDRPRGALARRRVHALREEERAARRRQGEAGRHRLAGALLARPADLPQGRRARLRRHPRPRPADLLPRPGPASRHPRRAPPQGHARRGGARSRRSSSTTAASPTSSSSSRPTPRSPTCGASRAPAPSPRPSRSSTSTAT